jgi:hypothetical protein
MSALKNSESVSNELARQLNTTPYRFISFRGVEGALGLKGTLCFCWKKGYFEKKVGGNLSSLPPPPPVPTPLFAISGKALLQSSRWWSTSEMLTLEESGSENLSMLLRD